MNQVRLIYKVLSGDASPDEVALLEHWMAMSTDNKAAFEDIRILWENSIKEGADRSETDGTGFLRIRRLIQLKERRRKMLRAFYYILLFVILLIFIFLTCYFLATQVKTSIYMDMVPALQCLMD